MGSAPSSRVLGVVPMLRPAAILFLRREADAFLGKARDAALSPMAKRIKRDLAKAKKAAPEAAAAA